MQDNYKFSIPAGLRPVRTSATAKTPRSEEQEPLKKVKTPEPRPESSRLQSSRKHYLALARKLGQTAQLRLPSPKRGWCCCMGKAQFKSERELEALELTKLLAQARDHR